MQPRQLQLSDVSKKCAFLLMTVPPEKNLKSLPNGVRTAYVLYNNGLYYIDLDAEKKCTEINIESRRLAELKQKLDINIKEFVAKNPETVTWIYIDGMSSEQLQTVYSYTNFFPNWLSKVIFLSQRTTELFKKACALEAQIRELEQQIVRLEALCSRKFLPADMENVYPDTHKIKNSDVRPTDYKLVKLVELQRRVNLFEHKNNKSALKDHIQEVSAIAARLNVLTPQYNTAVDQFQASDDELSKYSKETLTKDNFRPNVRSDFNKLPLHTRVAAASMMPGSTSLGALIDITAQLKKLYEAELRTSFSAATGKILQFETFEKLFAEDFKKTVKEHFKEFARKPTAEMADIKNEYSRLVQEFWRKKADLQITSEEKRNDFNNYFKTLLYLSCIHEAFRFTDKIQRLGAAEIASALAKAVFGGDNIVSEFTGLSVGQIENSFAMMPIGSEMVTPVEQSFSLWLEIAIWLQGLYQRSFDQINPLFKQDGRIDPAGLKHLGDDDDRLFFKYKAPLVKWLLAQYHQQHYKNLLLQLPPQLVEGLLPLLPNDFQTLYRAKYQLAQQPAVSVSVSRELEHATSAPAAAPAPRHESAVATSPTLFQPAPAPARKLLQFDDLEAVKDSENLEKFATLHTMLLGSVLTDAQNKLIESLKEPIISVLSSYKGAHFSAYGIPTILKAQRNINEVTTAFDKITSSATPRDYLIELYMVWSKVYGKSSTTIGPKSEVILASAFNMLHRSAERKAENNAAASSRPGERP